MFEKEVKFLCYQCSKIILVNREEIQDKQVLCGKCESICEVPEQIGPRIVIDDFMLEDKIGSGAFGSVWKAHQFSMDRKVALKILNHSELDNESIRNFINEAKVVAKLNHPNIITAYKAGMDCGVLFFAMELLRGDNLKSILQKQKKLKQNKVVKIAIDITKALGYAWETSQLVHRDIKPDNIILTDDGKTRLMDLGISKFTEETEDTSDIIEGTPNYICPEQITGNVMDIRGDFYSLGATMFHLVSGRLPFKGNKEEILDKHLDEKPQPLKFLAPGVNEELIELIEKLLSKKPENRPQSAEELLEELERISNLLDKSTPKETPNDDQKNKVFVLYALAGAIALIIILLTTGNSKTNEKNVSQDTPETEKSVTVPPKEEPNKEVTQKKPAQSVNYLYFHDINDYNTFEKSKPVKEAVTNEISLDIKSRDSHFGIQFKGFLRIPVSGKYTFYLKADDNARLFINQKICTKSGFGKEGKGEVNLQKGLNQFQIDFIQRSGGSHLTLEVEGPTMSRQEIPRSWLREANKN